MRTNPWQMKLTGVRILKGLFLNLLLGSLLASFSPAFADTCPGQDLTSATFPDVINGTLNTPPDINFFKFSGQAGAVIQVDLEGAPTGNGTLADPLLGLFDSGCNNIALDDDNGSNANSRLLFRIPADGVFVIAATSYPDFGFTGGGWYSGTYQLTVAPGQTVGSISGRLVDAVTGAPLSGIADSAYMSLYQCTDLVDDPSCQYFNNWLGDQSTDNQGRFRFDNDSVGQLLEAGTYLIRGLADKHYLASTGPFAVGNGENKDLGNVRLQPVPYGFSNIKTNCNIPSSGGTCSYSVNITNQLTTLLDGAVWSQVEGDGIGSPLSFTNLQTANPQQLTLRPGASKAVQFQFYVPGTVSDGAFICARIWAGQNRLSPYFNTVAEQGLFCIQKGVSGPFSVVPEKKAKMLFRQLKGHP